MGESQFRRGGGVGVGSVEHGDALLGRLFHVYVVHAYTGPAYDLQYVGGGNYLVGDTCTAAHQHRMVTGNSFAQCRFVHAVYHVNLETVLFPEVINTFFGDLVRYQDSLCHTYLLVKNSYKDVPTTGWETAESVNTGRCQQQRRQQQQEELGKLPRNKDAKDAEKVIS